MKSSLITLANFGADYALINYKISCDALLQSELRFNPPCTVSAFNLAKKVPAIKCFHWLSINFLGDCFRLSFFSAYSFEGSALAFLYY